MQTLNFDTTKFILLLIKRRQVRTPGNTILTAILLPSIFPEGQAIRCCCISEHSYCQGTQVYHFNCTVLAMDLSSLPGMKGMKLLAAMAVQKQVGTKTELSAWWGDTDVLQLDPVLQAAHCQYIEERMAPFIAAGFLTN